MTQQEDIYGEIWRMARTLLSRSDVRTKSLRLEKTDLPTLYSLRIGSINQRNSERHPGPALPSV